jgi:hypothetical protein
MNRLLSVTALCVGLAATTATQANAQYPYFPPMPVIPVGPMPVYPYPGVTPWNGSLTIHDSYFSPGRNSIMPGTMPIVTPNGTHWLGADGKPHGQYIDPAGNGVVYYSNPNAGGGGRSQGPIVPTVQPQHGYRPINNAPMPLSVGLSGR